jgi:hypothetical protein
LAGVDGVPHYWYAQFIADQRLPANPPSEAAGYKSDWPPLYHLLTAAITGWIDTCHPPSTSPRHRRRRSWPPPLVPAGARQFCTPDELSPGGKKSVWHLGQFPIFPPGRCW